MPYVPLDDGFHSHRKVIAAGNEAVGLHARSLSWCGANLTDGHIPFAVDDMLAGRRAKTLRTNLIDAGLRDKCVIHNDCSAVHDWAELNDTADELKEARRKNRERQAEWRRKRRDARESESGDTA